MSDTFKFLNNEKSQGSSAAQNFLNQKLAKNKYMSTSDPNNPYSMGEGSIPGGEAYEMDRKILNQNEIDAFNEKNKGGSYGDHSGLNAYNVKRYNEGRWGSGDLDAEALAEKFGLDRTEGAASGENAIYGTNADGSRVFIGNTHNNVEELKSNSELIAAHSAQAHEDEIKHSPDALSSGGDVKGAILNLWKKGAGEKAPEPIKEEMKPIEHSAEIKQAKERVQQYETDVMSGKTSEEIYGKGEALAEEKYNFDATQGAAGIGTSPVSASDQASTDATASFLNKKVSDTKNKYQFIPAT